MYSVLVVSHIGSRYPIMPRLVVRCVTNRFVKGLLCFFVRFFSSIQYNIYFRFWQLADCDQQLCCHQQRQWLQMMWSSSHWCVALLWVALLSYEFIFLSFRYLAEIWSVWLVFYIFLLASYEMWRCCTWCNVDVADCRLFVSYSSTYIVW